MVTRPYINYCKGSQILINGQSLYCENFVTNSSSGLQSFLAQIESRDYLSTSLFLLQWIPSMSTSTMTDSIRSSLSPLTFSLSYGEDATKSHYFMRVVKSPNLGWIIIFKIGRKLRYPAWKQIPRLRNTRFTIFPEYSNCTPHPKTAQSNQHIYNL